MGTLKNERTIAQKKKILRLLTKGKKITQYQALQPPIKCMRLASRISDLRKDGHSIITEMIEVEKGVRIARYSLKKTA